MWFFYRYFFDFDCRDAWREDADIIKFLRCKNYNKRGKYKTKAPKNGSYKKSVVNLARNKLRAPGDRVMGEKGQTNGLC